MELLQKNREESSSQAFFHACFVVSQIGNLSKEQMQRLDGIMQAALKQFERPIPMLMQMAALCSRQSKYAEAESCYREVLKNNSGNVQAMNNLAVLLALQGVKLDESLQLINQAIDFSGPMGIMLDSRSSVYLAMKEREKALQDISDALAEEETPVRLFHYSQILEALGRNPEAKEAFGKALKKGLLPWMLLPPELPAFERLNKLP